MIISNNENIYIDNLKDKLEESGTKMLKEVTLYTNKTFKLEIILKCERCKDLAEEPYSSECCGRLYCEKCSLYLSLDSCTHCLKNLKIIRNIFAKNLLLAGSFECIYKCGQFYNFTSLKSHKLLCEKKPYKCEIENCNFEGNKSVFFKHIIKKHAAFFLILCENYSDFEKNIEKLKDIRNNLNLSHKTSSKTIPRIPMLSNFQMMNLDSNGELLNNFRNIASNDYNNIFRNRFSPPLTFSQLQNESNGYNEALNNRRNANYFNNTFSGNDNHLGYFPRVNNNNNQNGSMLLTNNNFNSFYNPNEMLLNNLANNNNTNDIDYNSSIGSDYTEHQPFRFNNGIIRNRNLNFNFQQHTVSDDNIISNDDQSINQSNDSYMSPDHSYIGMNYD